MSDKPVIIFGLVIFLALATFPTWYTFGAGAVFSTDASPPELEPPAGALRYSAPWPGGEIGLSDLRGQFESFGLAPLSGEAELFVDPKTGKTWLLDGERRYLVAPDEDHGTLQIYDGCVEPVDTMRAEHMALLLEWRDGVIREGDRSTVEINGQPYAKSLTKTCLQCHSDRNTFCYRCHEYANTLPAWPARKPVEENLGIRCWNCHLKPAEEANDG